MSGFKTLKTLGDHVPSFAAVDWKALPKVCLHEHIDGGLRPGTLVELARERGLELPHDEPVQVGRWMAQNAYSGSLERYLEGFAYTVEAMATEAACERVAFELAEDAREEGCVLGEFRMAPQLFERFGLSAEAATEALLRGLRRSPLPSGLIVCGMRQMAPDATLRAARLAARYQHDGVIGFDLAGPERGFPAADHRTAIDTALAAGLGLTLHAGEADEGHNVIAAGRLGARRIGHGITVVHQATGQAPRWTDIAREMGLHFEVCPSSNVHTGAAACIAEHPIAAMVEARLSVSCSTDNRLMSATTLCAELQALHKQAGLPVQVLAEMQAAGMRASFLPAPVREAALARLHDWQMANGL